MATKMSSVILVFSSFFLLTGLAGAVTPSGLGYVGVHTAGLEYYDETLSVAISPDESVLATGTEGHVIITSLESRQVLKKLDVGDHATVVEFSPSGDYLVVGLKSDNLQSSAVKIYTTNDWNKSGNEFKNGKNPRDVSFSEDGTKILVQGQNKDAFELSIPELDIIGHLENLHTDQLQCSDYGSGGSFAITGGLDGVVGIWNMSDHSLTSYIEIENSEIVDCIISPDSSTYSILIDNGHLQTYWQNGTMVEESDIDFIEAVQIKWSADGDHMFVLETHVLPSLQRLRATDWVIDEITHIGHHVRTFDITADAQTMVTSTGTIHVGTYQSHFQPVGYGIEGADFDGDGVPDSLDEDDDGDGISDVYDKCSSTTSDCSMSADPEYIRNIEFNINSQSLVISDSVTFSRYDSNALRNLTTSLLSDDNRIDVEELSWMSLAMCDNILERDVVDQWQTLVEIEGAQLSNGTLGCDPIEGISSNNFDDNSLRATFTWITTFDLSANPLAPYNITVKGISEAPTGSSALIAPQFPVKMAFSHSMAVDVSISMWEKDDGIIAVFMDEVPATGPGVDDLVMAFIVANLWIPITSILGIIGGVALIIKQSKEISIALVRSSSEKLAEEEEEDDDSYDDYEEYEESEFEEDEYSDSDVENEVWSQESESSPPKPSRGPPRVSTRRAAKVPYQSDIDEPVRARRQRVSGKQPAGSKRKTLADAAGDEEEYDYDLDAVYHDSAWETEYDEFEEPKVRKVKKVEVKDEEPVEENKVRRKVKRRNPKKSKKESKPKKEVVAKKVAVSKKQIIKPLEEDKSDSKEQDDDEDTAMDKALGMLTGSKDN